MCAHSNRDGMKRTPLMLAARYGNLSTVLTLLHEGAHRYRRDAQKRTATDLAIQVGHLQIAGIINADPERVSLLEVASEGKLVLAMGLLKQGVSATTNDPKHRQALLFFSYKSVKHTDSSRLRKACVTTAAATGIACSNIVPQLWLQLLWYGTALIAASANSKEYMVDLLLQQDDLDVSQCNSRGETALMHAAKGSLLAVPQQYERGALCWSTWYLSQGTSSRITRRACNSSSITLLTSGLVRPQWKLKGNCTRSCQLLCRTLKTLRLVLLCVDCFRAQCSIIVHIAYYSNTITECALPVVNSACCNCATSLQLLAAGASKAAVDRQGLTAEHYAYKCNHLNMVLYKGLSTVAQEISSSIEKTKRRTSITSLANSSSNSVLAASGKMSGALPPLH
eukprot:19537-Heterococcus_DN1.PRE.1